MKICVDCQKEVGGTKAIKIREDRVIRGIRAVKRALKISKENELYVCEKCLEVHKERRKSFEKTMTFFAVLAGLVVILLLITIGLSGRIEVWTILSAVMIGVLLLFFSLVFRYVPATVSTEPVMIPAEKMQMKKPVRKKIKKKGGK